MERFWVQDYSSKKDVSLSYTVYVLLAQISGRFGATFWVGDINFISVQALWSEDCLSVSECELPTKGKLIKLLSLVSSI